MNRKQLKTKAMDIITATAIMMATMNGFSANEQTVVNPVIEGNVVTSVEVMERQAGSDLLTLKCKEFYAYDDDERLVQKEVWTWNSNNMEWQKSHCWNYTYDADGYTVEFAYWNEKEANYSRQMRKQDVNEGIDGTLVVIQYIRHQKDSDWQVTDSYLMLRTDDVLLATAF